MSPEVVSPHCKSRDKLLAGVTSETPKAVCVYSHPDRDGTASDHAARPSRSRELQVWLRGGGKTV